MRRLALALALGGCAKRSPPPEPTPAPVVIDQSLLNPAAQARADSGRPRFIDADVKFMQGMIQHHAQAILIAKWAPTHGASESVRKLCERIVVAQRDEIMMMSNWLRERKLEVPVADTLGRMAPHGEHAGHNMPGMGLAPGMLTPAQVAQLDSARGTRFDRLFLLGMIQHHEGAITMVRQLFATPGAAYDGVVYRFAADVEADQNAEIERMTLMLAAIPGSGSVPLTPRREFP